MDLFKFMKNWTLPLAMLAGVIGYFVFANFTFLEPTKPFMNGLISFLTPSLIFAQLLLTFCKIEPKELVPRVWHGWLLAIQAISCGIIVRWMNLIRRYSRRLWFVLFVLLLRQRQ